MLNDKVPKREFKLSFPITKELMEKCEPVEGAFYRLLEDKTVKQVRITSEDRIEATKRLGFEGQEPFCGAMAYIIDKKAKAIAEERADEPAA